jgi:hypothetical protein
MEPYLESGDYNAALEIAKDTAKEMVQEEGGGVGAENSREEEQPEASGGPEKRNE